MMKFLELSISGLSTGAVYALIALGFSIIFKASGVVNFAHGSLVLLGGYLVATIGSEHGFLVGLVGAIVIMMVVTIIIERGIIRPLVKRGADQTTLAIATIGIDIIILTDISRRLGSRVLNTGGPWGSSVVEFNGYSIPQARLYAIAISVVLIGVFLAMFRYSNWGVSMRACAEDEEAAALMGIRLGAVSASSWMVAGFIAVFGALFLTSVPSPGLDASTGMTALKAFPAAMVGGLDSTTGALAGGMIIGIIETMTSGYESNIPFLGGGFGSLTPWIVMTLILLVRPSGLFGTREVTRV